MDLSVIIPAKGNSKGIKNKNLKKIGGKTLLERSIIEAKKSRFIKSIYVSSESNKILKYAKSLNCKLVKRPNNLSTTLASSESALLHAIKYIKKTENFTSTYICFMQCTSPFQSYIDIDNAFLKLQKTNNDCIFSVTPFKSNLWSISKSKLLPLGHDPNRRKMRQKINNIIRENGAFYIFNTESFLKTKSRFCNKPMSFISNYFSRYEVDDDNDLVISNLLSDKFTL